MIAFWRDEEDLAKKLCWPAKRRVTAKEELASRRVYEKNVMTVTERNGMVVVAAR